MPDAAFGVCLRFVFRFPYGLYGMGIFLAAIVLLVVAIMHMGAGGDGQYDKTRNLTYSHKGTYGTAGFLNPKEAGQVLDFVPDLRKHHGTILGEVDGRVSVSRRKRASMAISRSTARAARKRHARSAST